MPVQIKKGRLDRRSGTYDYTLTYTGEDLLANLSLSEKLRIDFGIALPELEEFPTPEHFFAELARRLAERQPQWRVKRWATVGLLDFSKLLMYRDLNPADWPEDQPITDHPIVSRFFAAHANEGSGGAFAEEYAIDDDPQIHEHYPLIEDADSSQHSALIHAVQGENLVIEGPPGTGKSQTITNLIAAAMASGKRVLFVAEKLAALEVVKRRLDQAGLGDFCLELHSHRTQKRKVIDDIARRLARQTVVRPPDRIDAEIARYESLKNELRRYTQLINSKWGKTGFTIHEILFAASRYRAELGLDPITLQPAGFDGDMLTPDVQLQSLDCLERLASVYEGVAAQLGDEGELRTHPWCGVGNQNLQPVDSDRACNVLANWQQALHELAETVKDTGEEITGDGGDSLWELGAIEALKDDLISLPTLGGDEILAALPHLHGKQLAATHDHLSLIGKLRENHQFLAQTLHEGRLDDANTLPQLRGACQAFQSLGFTAEINLAQMTKQLRELEQLQATLDEIGQSMAEVAIGLGHDVNRYIRLDAAGLREFRAVMQLAAAVPTNLLRLRGGWCDEDALDELLPALEGQLQTIRKASEELSARFVLERIPSPDALEPLHGPAQKKGLLRWLDPEWRACRRTLRGLASRPGMRFRDLAESFDTLLRYARDKQALEGNHHYKEVLGNRFVGADTPVGDLMAIRDWHKAVRSRYGIGFGPKVAVGDALVEMPNKLAQGIQWHVQHGLLGRIDEALNDLAELRSVCRGYAPIQADNAPLFGSDGPLAILHEKLRRAISACQHNLKDPGASISLLDTTVARLESQQTMREAWRRGEVASEWFGDAVDLFAPPEDLDGATLMATRQTLDVARRVEGLRTERLRAAIYREPSKDTFAALERLGTRLQTAWQAHLDQRADFVSFAEVDLEAWQVRVEGRLDLLQARNREALSKPEWLGNWLDFVRARQEAEHIGFGQLAAAMEDGRIPPPAIKAGYNLAVNDLLARQILKENPTLAQFSGNAQVQRQKQFRDYDEKLKALQRERIAWRIAQNEVPPGTTGGRVSEYTGLALLRHQTGIQRRHLPLRQLMTRAGTALAALKPCFMMGPMSVAQYLPPGRLQFDLVVMDEASQIRPEDAVGAIARGGQLVVVGDPKQLPPTNFFNKAIDDDDEDATAIQISESILDAAMPLFEARRLTWHYRSHHEDLIAFSNDAFYDSKLVVFPAPHYESDDYGVKFTRVRHGRFVNRRNVEEAHVIAKAVQQHLSKRPDESLGVAAMNAEQRDQIESAVEAIAKEDSEFRDALEHNLQLGQPFFIKNLENVQGDERDVVFISCTYGPQDPGGRVLQRFGPINSDVGWRRLNVLFTRAKKRMHIFSSMGSDDIVLTAEHRRGVVAFKDFLAFAETGKLHWSRASGRAPDSDFEIAVGSALREAGFDCEPQVGVAGFFIDLAVRDPGNPGRYLMGIECDGATYHSAKSVRDRDRLRQTVLEGLGWKIRRIWSTDWYRNPRAEIEPILRELNATKTEAPAAPPETNGPLNLDNVIDWPTVDDSSPTISATEPLDLRSKLIEFDREVIRPAHPGTPEGQRLLRPAMLEALLEFRPVSKAEFAETLPLYLRQTTSSAEGRYLERVLRMIAEDEREELATA